MSNKAIAKVLSGKALGNANVARMLKDVPTQQIGDEIFGNNVQQAVEKWLKAMIAWKGHKYPFTHDIGELFEVAKKASLSKPANVDADLAETLTDYAEKERYESVRKGPPLARAALLALLDAVAAWAEEVGVRKEYSPVMRRRNPAPGPTAARSRIPRTIARPTSARSS